MTHVQPVENPVLAAMREVGIIPATPPAPAPAPVGGDTPIAAAGDPHAQRYAAAALDDECRTVATTAEGARNHTLHSAAVKLATLVAAGHLDHHTVTDRLTTAARECGLGDREIERTIRSGTTWGLQHPREVRLNPPAPEAHILDTHTGHSNTDMPDDMHSGQLRVAESFARTHEGRLLHVHGIGWHHWCGTHWVEDHDGKTRRELIDHLKTLRHASVDMPEKARDRLISDVKRCESAAGMSGVLDIARNMRALTASVTMIDADPMLFNAKNGTLDLRTGTLRDHDPSDLITKCARSNIDVSAHSATWETFLATVLPDPDVRTYLQRVMGVALLGTVREHILPILTGTGGNGKSVFIDAALHAFGDYGLTVDPQLVIQTRHERHGTFMADLKGARLVVTSETNEGERLAASTVKRLTGGDKIRANRMRENPFEFTPSHTLLFVTNHRPQVSADDSALWRRLTVVPFDVTIPAEDQDQQLPEKLQAESSAVLSWCYQGWLEYQARGLQPPEAVRARTSEYRSESDPLGRFIDEECDTSQPYTQVRARLLFDAWATWAMRNGHQPITQHEFGRRMAARGYERKRGKGGAYVYLGIELTDNSENEGITL